MQTLVFLSLRGRGCICVKLSSSVFIFLPPPPVVFFYSLAHLYRSHSLTDFRDLWLKRRVYASSTSFLGCKQKIFIFSPIFRKNGENYNGKDMLNIEIGITSFFCTRYRDTFCVYGSGSGVGEFKHAIWIFREQRELPWQPNLGKNKPKLHLFQFCARHPEFFRIKTWF